MWISLSLNSREHFKAPSSYYKEKFNYKSVWWMISRIVYEVIVIWARRKGRLGFDVDNDIDTNSNADMDTNMLSHVDMTYI